MQRLNLKLVQVIVLILSFGVTTPVRAAPAQPCVPPAPPRALARPTQALAATPMPPALAHNLPPLTAVLLVGPIDGDDGAWTIQEKQNMDLAAAELEANGVTVHRFYTPDNDWDQIVAAAQGAHFLFYRGHGVYWSSMPTPIVEGFALKDDFISADRIRADLALAPNAIVMLYGCFTAGSSSIDNPPIDSTEAQRRVGQYSAPFFDIGASGYYANWFGNAFQMYVRSLFHGLTLGGAYEAFYDFNATTVERYTHPAHAELAMWLDKDFWDDKWQYNNAFAGQPDRTLRDLFEITTMELSTASVSYLAEPTSAPWVYAVSVGSSSAKTFPWNATVAPEGLTWLSVTPHSGNSGEQLTITLTPTALPPGAYAATIRVLAGDPQIANGDQTITVTMNIVEQIHTVYLPLVGRP